MRRAWIGIRIPLAQWSAAPRTLRGLGVLTGPRGLAERMVAILTRKTSVYRGYKVFVLDAINELSLHRPDAAQWWRENTPHLLNPNRKFVFSWESCVVED